MKYSRALRDFLKHFFDWFGKHLAAIGSITSLLIAAWALYYTGMQTNLLGKQLDESRKQEAAQLVLNINNELRNKENPRSKIVAALADGKSLQGFSDEQIDSYLMMWELVDSLMERNLIDHDSAYDVFSYDVERAYCSAYIRDYVRTVRSESAMDAADYGGFTNLGRTFLIEDGDDPCPSDFIDNKSY